MYIPLLEKVKHAYIVKILSFTALATIVKMLTGLISVKVAAAIIGPMGVALLGQLSNFSSIAMAVSSGGINNGITKYIAEYRESDHQIRILISTAFKFTIWCSLISGILMIIFHNVLSKYVMLSLNYGYVFILFGFTVILYAFNMMLISILNGYKEFKKYVYVNIVGSIFGLIFTLSFVLILGLKGALISAVTFQSIMFFITLFMLRKLPWVSFDYIKEQYDNKTAKKLFSYTLMTLVSTITVPVSQMLLRGYVISSISPIEAGWWEGMNRISNMYLMVITTSFGVYYLPRLSELKDKIELKKEIYKAYKVIIPMLLISFLFIYLLKTYIIRLLFTPDFFPMETFFIWQLLGDFFKISSWLLAFLMVAKSMTRKFVFTEILFSLLFVGLGFLFMHYNGVVGITQAYMINYILYFVFMIFLFRKIIL